jgi:hypothetical protein
MRPIRRYELVSLIIPAGNTALKIAFPDIPQLRSDVTQDVIVRSLETFTAEAVPADPFQNPLMTNAQLGKCFLTLYIQQEESFKSLPAIKLMNIYNAASAAAYFYTDELVQTQNLLVDWTKSYLNLSSSLANGAIVIFALGVMYQRLPGGTIAALQTKQNPVNGSVYQSDWYAGT